MFQSKNIFGMAEAYVTDVKGSWSSVVSRTAIRLWASNQLAERRGSSHNRAGHRASGAWDGAQIQFKAYGHFAHPMETRDITDQVEWASDIPDVATVDSHGLATSGICGIAGVTATATNAIGVPFSSEAVLTATATFTVAVPNDLSCPQPGP